VTSGQRRRWSRIVTSDFIQSLDVLGIEGTRKKFLRAKDTTWLRWNHPL
jgi:hypothetical protein